MSEQDTFSVRRARRGTRCHCSPSTARLPARSSRRPTRPSSGCP